MYSGHKEQHVLQKVLKHKRMWCGGGKTWKVSMTGTKLVREEAQDEERYKMRGPE